MLRQKRLRRIVGAVLIVTGALLMWLAPEPTFGGPAGAGLILLFAGIALELVGLALERRANGK